MSTCVDFTFEDKQVIDVILVIIALLSFYIDFDPLVFFILILDD